MSLINDALKRARESQPNAAPSGMSPLRPVETHRQERDFNLVLPVVITFLVVTAFILIGLALAKHTGKSVAKTTAIAPPVAPQPAAAAVAPVVANPPAPVLPVTNPPVLPVATIIPAVTNPPVAKPLRVQGIAYDAVRPSAIVGGKAVYVGSLIDGLRVTAISPDSVTLAGNGRTNTLVVGSP